MNWTAPWRSARSFRSDLDPVASGHVSFQGSLRLLHLDDRLPV
jgi:hypothetical protein